MNDKSQSLRRNGYLIIRKFLSDTDADLLLDKIKYPFKVMLNRYGMLDENLY